MILADGANSCVKSSAQQTVLQLLCVIIPFGIRDPRRMDEGRKRVIGIMAAILASLHMRTADDLFGGPEGSPATRIS